MNREEDYIDWDKEAPLLCAISKKNPFKVPEEYFNSLNSQILSQVELDDIKSESIFEVPENYFNQLESQIMSQIRIDEMINQNDGFTVPETYFEESQNVIEQSVKSSKKSAKIINLNMIRFAAAACILLTTSVGIYININRQQSVSYQLSKLPEEAIENYLLLHTDANDLPAIMNNLDDQSVFALDQNQLTDDQIKDYLDYNP